MRRSFKNLTWKFWTFFVGIIFTFFVLISTNYFFKARNIEITFFDSNPENLEIQKKLVEILENENKSFLDFIFLDDNLIEKFLKDEYSQVRDLKISRKILWKEFTSGNLNLKIVVTKNKEFFYGCVPESSEFLITCMYGNEFGEFFKEFFETDVNNKLIKFEVDAKVLLTSGEEKKDFDSLSGTRIYKEADFLILKEIYLWLQKNGFEVEKIIVGELKIVKFVNRNYIVIVSLDKGYLETLKDFEIVSKAGKLEKYINEEQDKIDYIDLSFKNKVFWKLKNGFENDTESAIMSSTTATSSNR